MSRNRTVYRCTACQAEYRRWQGQCSGCQEWNTIEAVATAPRGSSGSVSSGPAARVEPLNAQTSRVERKPTGIGEMDRVLGGGFVAGSAVLLGGAPGIGKSTLLLQVLASMASRTYRCVYDSGEESPEQVRNRAERLGVIAAEIGITATERAEAIAALMRQDARPDVLVVDSVQMLTSEGVDAAPGSPSQMRACTQMLIQAAKESGTVLVLVGHVTKDSAIAGPKQIEHMVDAVLRFDQETDAAFRVLRGEKNRFGSTDEVGVFEMTDTGMHPVANPSETFLLDRATGTPGSAIFPSLEGSRPILLETQTLVAPSQYGTPRRTVVGWDQGRLAMIVAVLHARCGINICDSDVYLNISGGMRVAEPAADLAVAAALASAVADRPIPPETACFGEIGLGGEIRPVAHADRRIREAARMGFTRIIAPPERGGRRSPAPDGVELIRHTALVDVVSAISVRQAA